jgi:hypothetical protein
MRGEEIKEISCYRLERRKVPGEFLFLLAAAAADAMERKLNFLPFRSFKTMAAKMSLGNYVNFIKNGNGHGRRKLLSLRRD